MNLKPLGDRLLVKPLEQENQTPSGIVLPDSAKETPMQGQVLAAGPGVRGEDGTRMPMDVAVGDMILYPKYTGIEIKVENKKRLILKLGDVLAVVGLDNG